MEPFFNSIQWTISLEILQQQNNPNANFLSTSFGQFMFRQFFSTYLKVIRQLLQQLLELINSEFSGSIFHWRLAWSKECPSSKFESKSLLFGAIFQIIKCVTRANCPRTLRETFKRKVEHFNTSQKVLAICSLWEIYFLDKLAKFSVLFTNFHKVGYFMFDSDVLVTLAGLYWNCRQSLLKSELFCSLKDSIGKGELSFQEKTRRWDFIGTAVVSTIIIKGKWK